MKHPTLGTIAKHLEGKGFKADIQEKTQQVVLLLTVDKIDFPVFIRLDDSHKLMQVMAFLPCQFTQETVSDVSRMLHLFNKELDIPGFGLDEISKFSFYRLAIPIINGVLDDGLFESYLNTIQTVCKTFTPAIQAVGAGSLSFEELIKKASEGSV